MGDRLDITSRLLHPGKHLAQKRGVLDSPCDVDQSCQGPGSGNLDVDMRIAEPLRDEQIIARQGHRADADDHADRGPDIGHQVLGIGFQRDLDDPRKWQHLDDQPEARVGGPILNDFARPWPPESR